MRNCRWYLIFYCRVFFSFLDAFVMSTSLALVMSYARYTEAIKIQGFLANKRSVDVLLGSEVVPSRFYISLYSFERKRRMDILVAC